MSILIALLVTASLQAQTKAGYFYISQKDIVDNIEFFKAKDLPYSASYIVTGGDTVLMTQFNREHKPLRDNQDVVYIGFGAIERVDYGRYRGNLAVFVNVKYLTK